jgi:multiple sugar transport system ATP-binding protein
MATVNFENVDITYPGAEAPTVENFNLDIGDGEFLVIVGPSGCGKTTTLRALAGLEAVSGGRISIGEKDVTNVQPKDRDIAMVFQNYALYPHMTVERNMGFALKIAKVPNAEIKKKVMKAAELLDLTEYLARKPRALSGGQRQRVAMGRAIVREPNVFLMDEPLSNLDAKLRVSTRTQIASLQQRLGITTVYVTHDQTEAMTMGDRICVMNKGKIQQVGSPTELYSKPRNVFVANFIGSPAMNIGDFPIVDGHALIGKARFKLSDLLLDNLREQGDDLSKITIGFRPENLAVVDEGEEGAFPIKIEIVENLGSDYYGYGEIVDPAEGTHMYSKQLVLRTPGFIGLQENTVVWVRIDDGSHHIFSPTTHVRV